MSKAKQKFKVGDDVRMSYDGRMHLRPKSKDAQHGRIVGFCRDDTCIYVQLTGKKSRSMYHMDFWTRVK